MDKDPRKEARKFFRQSGGRVNGKGRNSTHWLFPDGSMIVLGDNDSHAVCATKIGIVRERFGSQRSRQLTGLARVGHAPRLNLEDLVASEHAKDRLKLMQSQARITYATVLHTLRIPERVLWSERHDSWVWIRHPLAVAVRELHGGGFIITTVLWSDNDLFALHPRPEAG